MEVFVIAFLRQTGAISYGAIDMQKHRRDEGTEGRRDGGAEGRRDGRTEGRMDGQTDGRTDGRREGGRDGRTFCVLSRVASQLKMLTFKMTSS